MAAPRVPLHLIAPSRRLDAALKLAAGPSAGTLSATLNYLCEQLATVCASPIASVYVLEERDDLVLRGNHGFPDAVLGEVRLKVGQGITGTALETMRPMTVDDAALVEQFEYFPQLAEERYPAFLALPLLAGPRPRGVLVMQREAGPFSENDVLLATAASRAVTAVLEAQHPQGANLLLHGTGNGRGRVLGVAQVLSRALPRRQRAAEISDDPTSDLLNAFTAEREDLRALADRARSAAEGRVRELEEAATATEDVRLQERAMEHLNARLPPSLALERIAAEFARALASHGPAARRAVDVEAFLGAVAHRYAGLEPTRVRRGEVVAAVHLSGISALRAWASGAVGALVAGSAEESTGVPVLTALRVPVASGLRQLFDTVGNGTRVALDSDSGEVYVNPTAAQAAAWRR
ncbi:MAG TPA: GAF domain-containing protein [Myxococcales bacterium]|nr:GAF domain-containing protein [Myxococcales bacterium]